MRIRQFISIYLTARTLSLMLCALLAGCIVLRLSAKATVAASIKRSEHLTFDGTKMYLLTRGADRSAPVLLWLHGGPGGAERPLFRYFNSELENHFLVVYWDQRGAGRSFDPKADPHRLTIAQHVVDLDAVVDHLRQSFGQDKVILMGHSWGAALGLVYAHAHPDKVAAFIGVNPMVSMREGQQAEYDFVLAEASRCKDNGALARLRKIGPPPYKEVGQVLAIEKLVQRYGGVFHKEPRRTWIMVRAISRGLVTPWEIPGLIHGNNVSLEAMNQELLALDLARSVPSTGVPVLFFLGRYDRHADGKLAATYFTTLLAPVKRLVWFEKSAHNVPFEEPRLFNATVVRELQSIGVRLAAGEGVQHK